MPSEEEKMKRQMNRMRRHDKIGKHKAQVDCLLDRMHRETGPRPDRDVAVMHGMKPAIHGPPMHEPVNKVEMRGVG